MSKWRKSLVIIAILVAGVWIAMWMGAALMSRLYSEDSQRTWPLGLGTLADVQKRYPPAPPSPAAYRLVEESAKLGINIAPRDEQLQEPSSPRQRSNEEVRIATETYTNAQIAKPSAAIEPLPPDLADYLAAHTGDLAAIRTIVLKEPVEWAVDYPNPHAPLPNLLGHRVLARLFLLNALDRARHGDHGAWDDAQAAVALTRNLWSRPELVSSLIALAISRSVNAVARKLPLPVPAWFDEFQEYDYMRAMVAARQAETSSIAESLSAETTTDDPRARRVVDAVLGPYTRMCEADALEIERLIAIDIARNRSCSVDRPELIRMRRAAAAWWNHPAKVVTRTNIDSVAWQRLLRFRAEMEATDRILRMRTGQPPLPQSKCEGLQWIYDERGLHASKEITLGGPGTVPLEFAR